MEEITNQQVQTESMTASQPIEADPKPTDTSMVTENVETPLEGSTTSDNIVEGISNPTEDKVSVESPTEVSDEIQKKLDRLKEYEVRDQELTDLKQKLGSQEQAVDNQIFAAQRELALLENQAQQEYIKLCTKYGVDYRPNMIDQSAQELLSKDPKAYYELSYQLQQLESTVTGRRSEVQNFITSRDINLAMERNSAILNASPAISNVISELVKEGGVDGSQIDNIVNYGILVAREAYEMGRRAAATQPPKVNPAEVLNTSVVTQQVPTPVTNLPTLTREDIAKMDLATYKKNKALIEKLRLEGRI